DQSQRAATRGAVQAHIRVSREALVVSASAGDRDMAMWRHAAVVGVVAMVLFAAPALEAQQPASPSATTQPKQSTTPAAPAQPQQLAPSPAPPGTLPANVESAPSAVPQPVSKCYTDIKQTSLVNRISVPPTASPRERCFSTQQARLAACAQQRGGERAT